MRRSELGFDLDAGWHNLFDAVKNLNFHIDSSPHKFDLVREKKLVLFAFFLEFFIAIVFVW